MFMQKRFVYFCIFAFMSGVMSYKKRLNVIESRLNTLEMRINIESQDIKIAKDSIEVLNSSVAEIEERVCLQGDLNVDRLENSQQSKFHNEAETFAVKLNGKRVLKAFKEQKAWSNAILSDLESRINRCEISVEQMINQYKVQVESLQRDVDKLKARDNEQGEQLVASQEDIDALKLHVSNHSKEKKKFKRIVAKVEKQQKIIEDIHSELDIIQDNQMKMTKLDCPEGWLNFETNCFIFEDSDMSYKKARDFCLEKGAQLVDIQSVQENTFVSQLSDGKKTWIGLTDEDTEGRWIWERTREIATYTNWRPGQPNNFGGTQHYALLGGTSTSPEQWDDAQEYHSFRVVCKMLQKGI